MNFTHSQYILIIDKNSTFHADLSPVTKENGQHYLFINAAGSHNQSISLSEAHLEILADEIGAYLDKLQQARVDAAAAITDAAIERVL